MLQKGEKGNSQLRRKIFSVILKVGGTMKKLILIAMLSAASSAAVAGGLPDRGHMVMIESVSAGQTEVSDIWECAPDIQAAYNASDLPRGDHIRTIRAIDSAVRSKMRYSPDKGPDTWSNFASEVLGGAASVGDCEDYALTAITLALCAGVPASKIGIAISEEGTSSPSMEKMNHAFAFYEDNGMPVSFANNAERGVRRIIASHGVGAWQTVERMRSVRDIFVAAVDAP